MRQKSGQKNNTELISFQISRQKQKCTLKFASGKKIFIYFIVLFLFTQNKAIKHKKLYIASLILNYDKIVENWSSSYLEKEYKSPGKLRLDLIIEIKPEDKLL